MEKVFWILTGKCRKKQTNAAGQTVSPDPAGVSAADKMEQKKTIRQVIADRLFCHGIFWGKPPMTKGFRHLGKVPVKGCGLTAAARYIKGSNYSIMPRLFAYSVYSSYH